MLLSVFRLDIIRVFILVLSHITRTKEGSIHGIEVRYREGLDILQNALDIRLLVQDVDL